MDHSPIDRKPLLALALLLVGLAAVQTLARVDNVATQLATYLLLSLVPGMALYLFIDRNPRLLELILAALIMSPVLVAGISAVALLCGASVTMAAGGLLVLTALCGLAAAWRARHVQWDATINTQRFALLAATVTVFVLLAGVMPLRFEWWRYWSDAWFHGAVVHQIHAYGIPPQDPYFVGLDLQYMWMYHILVVTLSNASRIDPMLVMPLVNLNALTGFAIATYLLSTAFRKRFAHGWFAVICVLLALNAVVWAFFPLRLIRVFVGDVTGWAELLRSFSVVPFDMDTVWNFLRVYYNQPFLLNKFIVATPFSLGLASMAAYWYGCVSYLRTPRRASLFMVALGALGMLAFHSLVGFITFVGVFGAFFLLYAFRRHITDFPLRRVLVLAVLSLTCFILITPYLYSVMHLKESEQLIPFSLKLSKTGGIIIGCALVLILSFFQFKGLTRERSTVPYFLLFATLVLFVFCNVITLPGPNQWDKPPFLIFFPLAVIGSWTFADRLARRHATRPYRRKVLVTAALLLLPVNTFAVLGYFNTPRHEEISADERQLSEWVRSATTRDAVFIDRDNHVVLLVTGPRRYYYGRDAYAEQWGYPRDVMAARRHVRDNLLSPEAPDPHTLAALGAMQSSVYVILRDATQKADTASKFDRHDGLFKKVYTGGTITVFEVDRRACSDLAAAASADGALLLRTE